MGLLPVNMGLLPVGEEETRDLKPISSCAAIGNICNTRGYITKYILGNLP